MISFLDHSFDDTLSPTNATTTPSRDAVEADPSVAFAKHCVAQLAVIGLVAFDVSHAESAH